jgi:hypothetical protein
MDPILRYLRLGHLVEPEAQATVRGIEGNVIGRVGGVGGRTVYPNASAQKRAMRCGSAQSKQMSRREDVAMSAPS